MKKIALILGILILSFVAKAQTVENIRTQQDGEKINIFYKIANSNDKQLFKVTISCLVNNDKKIILKTVTGDVSDNIQGGKEEYKAVWDVLKDVDELSNAEFFVAIEKKNDGSKLETSSKIGGFNVFKYEKPNKGQFFAAFQFLGGAKVGYMGKWGAALSVGVDAIDAEFSLLGSVSKSIVKKQNFQWNISLLGGMHNTYYSEYDYDTGDTVEYSQMAPAFGLGTDVAIGHLYLNVDVYVDEQSYGHTMFGIGWRF